MKPVPHGEVAGALDDIARLLDGAAFVAPGPAQAAHEAMRRRLIASLRDYLVPRLTDTGPGPVVTVIAGPGGTGKSTVLNSLAQDLVSPAGPSRPTTRHAVMWAGRTHTEAGWGEFLGRVQQRAGGVSDLVLSDDPLTRDVAFIDTPPLDLVRAGGTSLAADMLTLADLCIFVTSAARYADAVPFDFLTTATHAGIPVLYVLNKLPASSEAAAELTADFAARLSRRDLLLSPDPSLIFPIAADPIKRPFAGLPTEAVAPLRRELAELGNEEFREHIMSQTLTATVRAVVDQVGALTATLRAEEEQILLLEAMVTEAYSAELDRLDRELRAGELSSLATRKTWTEAAADLAGILTRRAGVAATRTADAWSHTSGGELLLDEGGAGLRRHGEETPFDAVEIVERWQSQAREQAVASLKPGIGSSRAVGRYLWRGVLDPELSPPAAVRRRLRAGAQETVARARNALVTAFDEALSKDAGRFLTLLAEAPSRDRLAELDEAVATLRGVYLDDADGDAAPGPGAMSNASAPDERDRHPEQVRESVDA